MKGTKMTRSIRSTPWGALSLAILCSTPAVATAGPSPCLGVELTGTPGRVVFADGFESGDTGRWEQPVIPGFSTLATVDLGVAVELDSQTRGEHVLELRWWLPGGALYQSVAVPFADGAHRAATRRLPGYPFPLEVEAIRPSRPERATLAGSGVVESRLPLAGTSVVDSALWGDWRLEVHFDGGEEACLPPLTFRLEP